jgi:hypothetical protein
MKNARSSSGDRLPNLGWRRLALWLLIFGEAVILLELWLLGHYEDVWQWTPLALLSAGLIACAWIARRPGPVSLRTFEWLMAAHVAAGAGGLFLHLKANVEFEMELHPDNAGWPLIQETLTGAIPALAPGAMFQLGLLGMLVCWRHPARSSGNEPARR